MSRRAVKANTAASSVRPAIVAPALVALGLVALTLISGCTGTSQAAQGTGVDAVGATVYPVGHRGRLPEINGTTLAGQRFTLPAATSGAIVVINVWASWCTQCQSESSALARLARSLKRKGVSFVGLDEQDTPGAARRFVAKVGLAYPQLIDNNGAVLAKLKLLPSFGIPSTLVVDREGQMAARIIGATDGTELGRIIQQVQRES